MLQIAYGDSEAITSNFFMVGQTGMITEFWCSHPNNHIQKSPEFRIYKLPGFTEAGCKRLITTPLINKQFHWGSQWTVTVFAKPKTQFTNLGLPDFQYYCFEGLNLLAFLSDIETVACDFHMSLNFIYKMIKFVNLGASHRLSEALLHAYSDRCTAVQEVGFRYFQ